jgi:hypothetical protein
MHAGTFWSKRTLEVLYLWFSLLYNQYTCCILSSINCSAHVHNKNKSDINLDNVS